VIPDGGEAVDALVDLGQLAPQHRHRVRTHVARVVAGPQAFHERPDVVKVEPDREQSPDLADDPQFGLDVGAVPAGGAVRTQQPVRLVVTQRPGADTGAPGQLTDQHHVPPTATSSHRKAKPCHRRQGNAAHVVVACAPPRAVGFPTR